MSLAVGDASQAAEAFLDAAGASASPGSAQAQAEATHELVHIVSVLDATVESQTFLVGERPTLADIALCCVLSPVVGPGRAIEAEPAQRRVPSFLRWFRTCRAIPAFSSCLGPDDTGDVTAIVGGNLAVSTTAATPVASSGAGADVVPTTVDGYPGVPAASCASAGALEASPILPEPRFRRGRLRVKEVLAGGDALLG